MASLKECRARAKRLGFNVRKLAKPWQGHIYKVNGWYVKTVAELTKAVSDMGRRQKASAMYRKLNGHRPKYGYKTVPRKKGGDS